MPNDKIWREVYTSKPYNVYLKNGRKAAMSEYEASLCSDDIEFIEYIGEGLPRHEYVSF